jgi:colicin import membrane protein
MEKELERLIQEDLDRTNAVVDERYNREQAAREKLMQHVYDTRAEQLKERGTIRYRREEELALERAAIEREMNRAAELQRREDEANAEAERKRRNDLDSQVEANKAQRALHVERNRIEAQASAASEEQYRTYLEREKAQVWVA